MSLARSVSMLLVPVSLCGQGVSSAAATLREFRIDAGHSAVEFSVPFLGHAVRGRFDDVQGTIVYAPAPNGGVGASAVSVAIATASVNSGSRHRDEHLRSEDFFDAARYPVILFQSTGFALRDSAFMMRGTLTMHGVARTVMIPFRADGAPIDDPHGSALVHFTGGLRIARREYGILGGSRHNDWFDALRSATMGDRCGHHPRGDRMAHRLRSRQAVRRPRREDRERGHRLRRDADASGDRKKSGVIARYRMGTRSARCRPFAARPRT